MAKAIQLDLRNMKLRDLIRLTSYALRELERRLVSETQIFDKYAAYKDCSIVETWVKNKQGKRYWYPYLKCRDRRPKSIYLGNKVVIERMVDQYKSMKGLVKQRDILAKELRKTLGFLSDIEMIIEAAEQMREAEKEALQDQAMLNEERRRGRRRYRRKGIELMAKFDECEISKRKVNK